VIAALIVLAAALAWGIFIYNRLVGDKSVGSSGILRTPNTFTSD